MAVILQDPTRERDPSSRHAFPDLPVEPELRASPTLAEDLIARYGAGEAATETFEVESHGGYLRTVTGTIAYLDEEAETFMLRENDRLLRVPIRDVRSASIG
jgi:hypothetical protein